MSQHQQVFTDDEIKRMEDNSFQRVDDLIEKYGPRLTGSDACLNTADSLFEEVKQITDSSSTQDFKLHPNAFLGWVSLLARLYFVTYPFFLMNIPIVSGIAMLIGDVIVVLEFFFYKEFTDHFYPEVRGRNVFGTIEPSEKVESTVIISGHHDSAPIFTLLYEHPHLYLPHLVSSYFFIFFMLFASIIALFKPLPLFVRLFGAIGLYPVFSFLNFPGKEGTPGAGDNLIASSIAIEIGKFLREKKILKHTRIVLISFDSEEAGLRGSRAYFKAHENEYKNTPTYHVNVDSCYFLDHLSYLTSDINCMQILSKEMVDELISIAKEFGVQSRGEPMHMFMGATDAAESAKIGIHSTTILGIPMDGNTKKKVVYHTPDDTTQYIERPIINVLLKMILRFVQKVDDGSFKI